VVAAGSRSEAGRSAIEQLAKAPAEVTFVRQFAYPTGAAYGILLDEYAPGWTHRIKSGDDVGKLIEPFAAIRPTKDLEAAAVSYGGPEIRERETRRDVEHKARLAELHRRFVEGPILILPRGRGASFGSAGITTIPRRRHGLFVVSDEGGLGHAGGLGCSRRHGSCKAHRSSPGGGRGEDNQRRRLDPRHRGWLGRPAWSSSG
jgi:hypothetical protein